MKMQIESRQLNGLVVLVADVFRDDRGFFMESYRQDQFLELGLPGQFLQDNHSGSVRGVVRGLHFQWDPPMSKLMRVTRGTAWLVAVDIRKGSPTFGKWYGVEASAENRRQVWAPPGFARGFCVLSDFAEVQYKCTAIYNPKCESGILWNDPAVGVEWPIAEPLLSEKDSKARTLEEWQKASESNAFTYSES